MEDIKHWLTSEMDYGKGVEIFAKHCPNKMYVRHFQHGNAKTQGKKLEYELKRLLKIPLADIVNQTCSNQQLIHAHHTPSQPSPKEKECFPPSVGLRGVYPTLISQAKELRNDLYTQIALMHKQLYDLGEGNDDATVKKRKTLLDKRIPLIEKHEQIYYAVEEYFLTGYIPDSLHALV